jgi:hypothetical protein
MTSWARSGGRAAAVLASLKLDDLKLDDLKLDEPWGQPPPAVRRAQLGRFSYPSGSG